MEQWKGTNRRLSEAQDEPGKELPDPQPTVAPEVSEQVDAVVIDPALVVVEPGKELGDSQLNEAPTEQVSKQDVVAINSTLVVVEPEKIPKRASRANKNAATLTLHGTAPPYQVLTVSERRLILCSLLGVRFLIVLDTTILAVALPSILGELGHVPYLSWLVASYLLTSSAFQPLTGRLSDVYGRRGLYLGALAFFAACSVLCGVATSFWFLTIGRLLQGVGGGCLAALTLVIGGDITPPHERAKVLGLLNSTATFGAMFGPLMGGLLTEGIGWRSIFYVNVPVCVICFVVGWIGMKRMRMLSTRLPLDWRGALLSVAVSACFILVVTWGGNEDVGYAWDSPVIICLAVATVLLAVLFLLAELHHELPILPLRLFRIRNFSVGCIVVFVTFTSVVPLDYYLAVYFQDVVGDTAIISGCKIMGFCAGCFVGLIIARKGTNSKVQILLSGSGAVTIVGAVIMLFYAKPDTNYGIIFVSNLLMGIGVGFQIPVAATLAQLGVEQKDIAVAMSAFSFFNMLGGTVGITIAGAVFNSAFSAAQPGTLVQDARAQGVSAVFIFVSCSAGLNTILGAFAVPLEDMPKKMRLSIAAF